jgi:nicotinamidase-related amidase
MSTALLIVDMQQQFRSLLDANPRLATAVEHINYAASLFRARARPVIHVADIEGRGGQPDTDAASIAEIDRQPGDGDLYKEFCNAFWRTDLDERLRAAGTRFVVVAGFAGEHCVTFTFNGARERGYGAAILQNGFVCEDPRQEDAILRCRPLIGYSAIAALHGE